MRLWRSNVGAGVPYSIVAQALDRLTSGDVEGAKQILRRAQVVRFGVKGQADTTGILSDGSRLEIEFKRPGGKQREEQERYQRMINRFGGTYIVANDPDALIVQMQAICRDKGIQI